jgi:hypothetical protein
MIVTAVFECTNGRRNKLDWAVLPPLNNPTAKLIVEQKGFLAAFNAKCPSCGAPAKGLPNLTFVE